MRHHLRTQKPFANIKILCVYQIPKFVFILRILKSCNVSKAFQSVPFYGRILRAPSPGHVQTSTYTYSRIISMVNKDNVCVCVCGHVYCTNGSDIWHMGNPICALRYILFRILGF